MTHQAMHIRKHVFQALLDKHQDLMKLISFDNTSKNIMQNFVNMYAITMLRGTSNDMIKVLFTILLEL